MIFNRVGLFIALAFIVVSCVDSNDSDLDDVRKSDFTADSNMVLSEVNMDAQAEPDAVDQDEDLNCDAHFKSAMNLPKPAHLVILHCEYWSSDRPVWLEHSYSFELEADDAFFEELIAHNGMVKHEDALAITNRQKNWFLPKDAVHYIGFHAEDDFDDFEVFKDLQTGHIFIRGSQY